MRRICNISFFALFSFFLLFGEAYALTNNDISIKLDPPFPQPNKEVTISLARVSSETLGANIAWYIDGIQKTNTNNLREVSLVTKGSGEETAVRVVVTDPLGTTVENSFTIKPYRVDMVISANTYVPYFYNGRSLPSNAGDTTVRAFVFNPEQVNPSSLSYVWRVNGKLQNHNLTRSINSITFNPLFEKNSSVVVQIFNDSGKQIAERNINIPSATPEVYFYEANPLRGLSPMALSDNFIFIGEETSLKAEPFYVEKNETNLRKVWSIDGSEINTNTESPYMLTLQKQAAEGSFRISFDIVNVKQFLQNAVANLNVSF